MLLWSPVDQRNSWPESNINLETSVRGKMSEEKQQWWDTVTFKSSCPSTMWQTSHPGL